MNKIQRKSKKYQPYTQFSSTYKRRLADTNGVQNVDKENENKTVGLHWATYENWGQMGIISRKTLNNGI